MSLASCCLLRLCFPVFVVFVDVTLLFLLFSLSTCNKMTDRYDFITKYS